MLYLYIHTPLTQKQSTTCVLDALFSSCTTKRNIYFFQTVNFEKGHLQLATHSDWLVLRVINLLQIWNIGVFNFLCVTINLPRLWKREDTSDDNANSLLCLICYSLHAYFLRFILLHSLTEAPAKLKSHCSSAKANIHFSDDHRISLCLHSFLLN